MELSFQVTYTDWKIDLDKTEEDTDISYGKSHLYTLLYKKSFKNEWMSYFKPEALNIFKKIFFLKHFKTCSNYGLSFYIKDIKWLTLEILWVIKNMKIGGKVGIWISE